MSLTGRQKLVKCFEQIIHTLKLRSTEIRVMFPEFGVFSFPKQNVLVFQFKRIVYVNIF